MGVKVNGATRLVGVMGWPVSHSRSPQMQNAAFAALGLDYVYVPLAVSPQDLSAAIRGLVALGFAGANVTVPHKSAVLPLLDELTPVAAAVGAANTIVVRSDGSTLGDNTDAYGFLTDLAAHGYNPRNSQNRKAVVIGAGGAARAIVYALGQAGLEVAVANRTPSHAEDLCAAIKGVLPQAAVSAHAFPGALQTLAPEAGLIVNTTSLGLHPSDPLPWDASVPFSPGQTVYDLVYSPGRGASLTPFLALAAQSGAYAYHGLGMLVHQGARSFELWTGQAAPVEVMLRAVLE